MVPSGVFISRSGDLRDEDRLEVLAVVPVEVDSATDPRDDPVRGVLPERPAVAAPVGAGHARRDPRRPVGDPQDVVAVEGEPGRVAHVVAPKAWRHVDGGMYPDALVDTTQERLDPRGQRDL